MSAFAVPFALAYVAATLLPSGLGHLARPDLFRAALRSHRLLPAIVARPFVAALGGAETAAGLAAVLLLAGAALPVSAAQLLAAAAGTGASFLAYLLVLLISRPRRALACGCSPWSGTLSRASLAPAAGLLLAGLLGRAAASAGALEVAAVGADAALPILWGVTLAAVVGLLPVTAPLPLAAEG